MEKLLSAPAKPGGPSVLSQLPKDKAATLTGKQFFPHLISGPFKDGLVTAFTASMILCLVAAAASWLRGGKYVHDPSRAGPTDEHDPDEVGPYGVPLEAHPDPAEAPELEEWMV
jgi:hypothetical protein